MKKSNLSLILAGSVLLALGTFTGCESTDSGGAHTTSNVYYGTGFYDPWYHGHYDNDYNVVVTPPDRPGFGGRPENPIARPPNASSRPPSASQLPASRPMPSIPSGPRPAPRGGGGGRRR